jgi:hypothetical protein
MGLTVQIRYTLIITPYLLISLFPYFRVIFTFRVESI